ncbi:radical SAM protein [Acutalibacter muris]|uniref:radical SAM protein n=1 Tax=Acutalibacter muris TaxID=1796620 RepID=UPI00272BC00E|nr:radical SAM protein [Acutalibacter muris]
MRVGLHDAESEHFRGKKKFPNYALMKISAWHKARGDTVEWWKPLGLFDRVYSSKVFDFTPENPYLPPDTVKGGTGYGLFTELPPEVDAMFPDYSIYPECDYAIGYLTRGCPNRCRWCIVPRKEGAIWPYRAWQDLVRPDTNKLVLMDNNILACEYGIEQLAGMINSGYKIDLNQGMDARLVTPEVADILARLKWMRHIRFSCDQESQIEPILRAYELLKERGVKPYRVFVYLLVTSDLDNASRRVEALKGLRGINLYAQAERNESLGIRPNKAQLEFAQRYVYSGRFRRETWKEYTEKRGMIL